MSDSNGLVASPAATEALQARIRAALADIDRAGLRRVLRPPVGIDLSSNDYLGLAQHPRLKQRMIAAVEELGCGSTGSRLLRGERDCFSAIEKRFAEFKGTERALYFSSGYLANLAVLTTFPQAGDTIYSDERNHASLIDGTRLSKALRVIYPHSQTPQVQASSVGEQQFIVTESVFSMDGDVAPLKALAAVGRPLIVDEAHAVGIYGQRGSGLIEELGIGKDVFLSINTAGKALGVAGAFVAGPAWAIEYLIQRARPFIFSTAPPPAVAAALDAALDVIADEPERRSSLRAISKHLRASLNNAGISVPDGDSPIIPIMLGDNDRAIRVAEEMQHQGFDVRAIRPPTVPVGTSRLRVSVNVLLSEDILERFVTVLQKTICAATS
ncbi:MAG: 8-amino-7-oxononanoate synthase [Acidobacteriota bacterium]